MSFISHSKYKTIIIILVIIAFVELIVRFLPMENLAGTGVYLANHRSHLLDASEPEFDYIIFGESRTLSLKGHKSTSSEPWSIYNLSMPAMGARYYTYYLRKYMKHRKKAPSAIIFAGDPAVFQSSWNLPMHDPNEVYTDTRDDTLIQYIKNKIVRRIGIATGRLPYRKATALNAGLWSHFSHRYLHLFSLTESIKQYNGPEKVFMLYERFPLEYKTYRWREPLAHYIFGFKANYFNKIKLPKHCKKSCKATWDPTCYPNIQRIQQNKILDLWMKRTNGQINLADLKKPETRWQYQTIREQNIQNFVLALNLAKVDLRPLKSLIKEASKHNIKVILAFAPGAKAYKDTTYFKNFDIRLKKLLTLNKNVKHAKFKTPFLSSKFFIDNAHYLCEGAEIVNQDFYKNIMPQVLKIAPPK